MISRTTKRFWQYFDALPHEAQRQAIRAYVLWRTNPRHPSLHFKCVSEKHAAYSVRIGIHWRVVGFRSDGAKEDIYTWFWIGSHAGYDQLLAGL